MQGWALPPWLLGCSHGNRRSLLQEPHTSLLAAPSAMAGNGAAVGSSPTHPLPGIPWDPYVPQGPLGWGRCAAPLSPVAGQLAAARRVAGVCLLCPLGGGGRKPRPSGHFQGDLWGPGLLTPTPSPPHWVALWVPPTVLSGGEGATRSPHWWRRAMPRGIHRSR